MIRNLTLSTLLLFASLAALGQAPSTCVQTLRLAQSTYEQGRLHELPEMLQNCLSSGFTTDERRQAYKLLVQSYIYLEEPEKADEAMLALLNTDHFFKPNEDVDPAEFVSLYNRFRTKPLFRAGVKFGPAINAPYSITDYSVTSDAVGAHTFSPGVTFFAGGVFEKDYLNGKLTIAPEAVFAARSWKEKGTAFNNDEDGQQDTEQEVTVKIKWIEVNPLVKYWLSKNPASRDQKIEPYLVGGPGVNFVLNATAEDAKLNRVEGQGSNTGPSVTITDSFKALNMSAIAGIGARIRVSEIFVNMDLRLQYGLTNVVNPDTRSNAETVFDYAWLPNDTRINSLTLNIAIQMARFSPKKLIK